MSPINFSAIPYGTWYGRVLRFPLKLIRGGATLPILQGPLKGARWIVGSSVHGCWLGNYEFPKCLLLQERVQKGSVVFDIGAQAGYHTLLSARLAGPGGAVYAFEPSPRNLRYLREHVAMHALNNVVVVEAAVSDFDGSAFFDAGPSCVAGHLSPEGTLPVRCLALDTAVLSGELPMPDYLKIDVEGAEMSVLRGAQRILSQHHPEIFLDTHGFLGGTFSSLHWECARFLSELGYQVKPIGSESFEDAHQFHARAEQTAGRLVA